MLEYGVQTIDARAADKESFTRALNDMLIDMGNDGWELDGVVNLREECKSFIFKREYKTLLKKEKPEKLQEKRKAKLFSSSGVKVSGVIDRLNLTDEEVLNIVKEWYHTYPEFVYNDDTFELDQICDEELKKL